MTYLVDDRCTACGACLLTCPEHAFVVAVPLTVRADRCTDCGECVEICPADAITRVSASGADHGVGAEGLSVAEQQEVHDRREWGVSA